MEEAIGVRKTGVWTRYRDFEHGVWFSGHKFVVGGEQIAPLPSSRSLRPPPPLPPPHLKVVCTNGRFLILVLQRHRTRLSYDLSDHFLQRRSMAIYAQ